MARTRKGQVITLKAAIPHDQFELCPLNGDWVVLKGGVVTLASPVSLDPSSEVKVLQLTESQTEQFFNLTDRKSDAPTTTTIAYNLDYQWNYAIRKLNQ